MGIDMHRPASRWIQGDGGRFWRAIQIAAGAALLVFCAAQAAAADGVQKLRDGNQGNDWAAFGRTYGEQHFSPLTQIQDKNVHRLGLAWSLDLEYPGNSVSAPIAVDGVVYVATGYSIVRAIDAVTGRQLWRYDPKVAEVAGPKLRNGWGIRGLAWWNGKIYVGTQEGRLIALDAKKGKPLWTVQTTSKEDVRFISGPPRVFAGKVIIGHGGADTGATRGYVTTYDAETGKQLWRFYTVPGNPADGFEDETQAMAAKTWSGKWWEFGGGGTVWNAMTYDEESDTIFLGIGNGAPWNKKLRSPGAGDDLFLCSIVALDARTGKYKWHYQVNPGESWDYNAAMDMQLATLTIGGKPRKVLMQAPKNGFFYVIDRETGKLISAEPYAKVTWAKSIDLTTGRPVEAPNVRFENGTEFELWPSPLGAHNWLPMSFSPKTGLVYIPTLELGAVYNDKGIDLKNWRRREGGSNDNAVNVRIKAEPDGGVSYLQAWDPVTQKRVWKVETPGYWSGGTLASAGNLVFQGQADGKFNAYAAATGKRLWTYNTRGAAIAPPITYSVKGKQYVTVLSGFGTSYGLFGDASAKFGWDARSQPRRVLTFALDGKGKLPPAPPFYKAKATPDPEFQPGASNITLGSTIYHQQCYICHGLEAISGGTAPDLRASMVPRVPEAFQQIVRGGAMTQTGMPGFENLSVDEVEGIRQYLRSRSQELQSAK
ncbi:PQQ-dependent dehydrogenase, methanol/ethanol family [Noviherbaspirillum sedimenti]|nr:PQQ-dependent dehydrogenase, methanol/ethanol family [Noviherbaspirillum sedimenti]